MSANGQADGAELRQRRGAGAKEGNGAAVGEERSSPTAAPAPAALASKNGNSVGGRRLKRSDSFAQQISRHSWFRWGMAHQLELSLAVVVVIVALNALTPPESVLSTYYTPAPSYHLKPVISRFMYLSFKVPGTTDRYFKGRDDAYFITFWVAVFWFLREAAMQYFWKPFARRCGIKEERSIVRFAEQGWSLAYYSVFWVLGVYIVQTSPYRNLRTEHLWKGYPHEDLTALTKWYYLVQTAFWIQQIIVLNLEAKRKDYAQMFTHHIITTALMSLSYVLNWTRIGTLILCNLDFADILLPLAKLFNYARNHRMADVTFVVFMLAWIITRHVIFMRLLYSVMYEPQTILKYDWRPREGYFFNRNVQVGFAGLLGSLQVLLLIWFGMIARVAYGALSGKHADDTRSEVDDESDRDDDFAVEDVPQPSTANGAAATNGQSIGSSIEQAKKGGH